MSGLRQLEATLAGKDPSSVGSASANKIRWSEYARRVGELSLDLLGPESLVVGDDYDLSHWQAGVPRHANADDLGRDRRDPAQHHRRARARPAEGAERMSAVTEERDDLVRGVRDLLSKRATLARTREVLEAGEGYDSALWDVMAQQLALPAMAVPEEYGGAGFGYAELVLVFEELGRALVPSPLFATAALALPALLAADDEGALSDLAPGLAAGETTGTLAWVEDDGSWDGGSATIASRSGDGWTLERPQGLRHRRCDGRRDPRDRRHAGRAVAVRRRVRCGRRSSVTPSRRSTRPATSRASSSPARRRGSSARPAAVRRSCPRRSTGPRSCSPPRWSAAPRRAWT